MSEQNDHSPKASGSLRRHAPPSWARSALTSGLLSLAAVVPGASIAAEPDRLQEGGVTPEHGQDLEADSPAFDPGGDTDLPFDTGAPAPSPQESSPDAAPLETEPADDPDGRLAPLAAPEAEVPGAPEDAPVAPVETQPTPPPAPGFAIEPPPSNATAPAPTPASPSPPQSLGAEPGSRPEPHRGRLWAVVRAAPADNAVPRQLPTLGTGVSGEPGPAEATADTGPVMAAAEVDRSELDRSSVAQGARFHLVESGESLWSIAEDLLGPDATAMSIAAEVARLWELNHDRISSGDPDLIAVGERLRLS
jgi:resuscitation-promoting factor RpfA